VRGWPLTVRTRLTLWYTGVLLVILLLVSVLSDSLLRWSVMHDVDQSLVTTAHVVREASEEVDAASVISGPELALRELLGPEFYDKFFRLLDPEGHTRARSRLRREGALPLSVEARANARRGRPTFETVQLADGPARILTLPVVRGGHVVQLVQVGMSLEGSRRTLSRYRTILVVLVPLAVGLAALGGALVAGRALRPVDTLSLTARRITAEDLTQRLPLRGTGDELDRLAETLNAMLARLEDAFAAVRRFAADAAHELRTPLTVLRGEIEVALRGERSPGEYRRVLQSSLEEVERLTHLAEDLLLLSRFSVTVSAPRQRVELEPLVVDALDAGTQLAHRRGVSITSTALTPAAVVGDAAALRRALLNLIDNAVKYTRAGGNVEVSLVRDDRIAAIAVRDSGIGIAPADAERVFHPFVRLEVARDGTEGGAGLGLSIARSIVLAHGGQLTLESSPREGSTFTIRLPTWGA
jgi:two-component system OmpR family sensor kinase